jgi:hypothetical protein
MHADLMLSLSYEIFFEMKRFECGNLYLVLDNILINPTYWTYESRNSW